MNKGQVQGQQLTHLFNTSYFSIDGGSQLYRSLEKPMKNGGSCFEAGSGVVFYKDDFHKAKLTSEGVSLIDQMGEFYIVRFFESLPRGFQDIAIDANGRGIEAGDRVTYVAGGRNTPLDYGFSVGVDYIVNSIQTENIDFIPSISVIGGESLLVPSNRFVLNAKKQFA